LLKAGGHLVVVTFHSLEDRIAKRFFASRCLEAPKGSRHLPEQKTAGPAPSFTLLNRRPLIPSEGETRSNPRARSAHLRAAVRTEAPAQPLDLAALGVPDIVRLTEDVACESKSSVMLRFFNICLSLALVVL